MSDTSRAEPRFKPETLLIAIFVVLCIGALLYVSSQRQQQLRSSALGMNGLQVWLASQEQDAQIFTGGWNIDVADVGLLVLPLHDSLPSIARDPPTSKKELVFQQDEYDLRLGHIQRKAQLVNTLIVLPKWRTGLRLTRLAHPALLIEPDRPEYILRKLLGRDAGGLSRIRRPFTAFDFGPDGGLSAQLYVAQVFEGRGCTPIIGRAGEMVLAECPLYAKRDDTRDTVLVLSDPDLLSNHGLRLGDNARIAADVLRAHAGEKRIVIDYSDAVWLRTEPTAAKRERTWSDLKRFFDYPFSLLWLGTGLVMAIVLWRAGIRDGPVSDANSKAASKLDAITARARLMRLTDQDGVLLGDYATARIAALSSAIFGTMRPAHLSDEEAVLAHIARRDPDLAQRVSQELETIRALPAHIPASTAISHVEAFETLLEHTAHVT